MTTPKLTFWQGVRAMLLSCSCPKFWESFPSKDLAGPWMAVALRTNPFRGPCERKTRLVRSGLYEAYIKARSLALDLDRETPCADGEIGVNWAVRRPAPGEMQ